MLGGIWERPIQSSRLRSAEARGGQSAYEFPLRQVDVGNALSVSNAIQVKSSDMKWQRYALKAIRIPLKSVYHTGRKALYLYTNSL